MSSRRQLDIDEAQYLYGKESLGLDELKEVKVKIPVSLLVRLHGMKILQGTTISETVAQALHAYFQREEDRPNRS